jgi:glycosyltransferase involved in cell wall biosynthesis
MKTLILSLGRNNSLPEYGKQIISRLDQNQFSLWISLYTTVEYPKGLDVKLIKTYQTTFSFLKNSIIILFPLFLVFAFRDLRKYDTLYLPYGHFWDLPFILLFKLFRKRVIYTVHDGILHKGEKSRTTQWIQNTRIKHSTDLIFLTKYVRNQIAYKYLKAKKTYIIPHGLLGSMIVSPISEDLNSLNILFLGRITPYKGIELLNEAVVGHSDNFLKLRICGKSDYNLIIKKANHIEVIDKYLSDTEIEEQLLWADVLVVPYEEATQSGIISLGINAELPMICTKVGGLPEQLETGECLWINYDVEQLKAAITKMKEKNLRTYFKDKMRSKKKTLSWSMIAESIQLVLNDAE